MSKNMCRTCMTQISVATRHCYPISKCFYKTPSDCDETVSIKELLQLVQPQIRVKFNDGLPQIMCWKCIKKLQKSYEFLEMYKNVDKELRRMVKDRRVAYEDNLSSLHESSCTVDETLEFVEPNLNEGNEFLEIYNEVNKEFSIMLKEVNDISEIYSKSSLIVDDNLKDNIALQEMEKFKKEIEKINGELFGIGEEDDIVNLWSKHEEEFPIYEISEEELFDNPYGDETDNELMSSDKSQNPPSSPKSDTENEINKKISRKISHRKDKTDTIIFNETAYNDANYSKKFKANDKKVDSESDSDDKVSQIEESTEKNQFDNDISRTISLSKCKTVSKIDNETALNNNFIESETSINVDNEIEKEISAKKRKTEDKINNKTVLEDKIGKGEKSTESIIENDSNNAVSDNQTDNEIDKYSNEAFSDSQTDNEIDNEKDSNKSVNKCKADYKINNDNFSQNSKSSEKCIAENELNECNKTDSNDTLREIQTDNENTVKKFTDNFSQNLKSPKNCNAENEIINKPSRKITPRKCKAVKKIYNQTDSSDESDFSESESEFEIDIGTSAKKSKSDNKINNETDSDDDDFSRNQYLSKKCIADNVINNTTKNEASQIISPNLPKADSKVNNESDSNANSAQITQEKSINKYKNKKGYSCTKCDSRLDNIKVWREHMREHQLGIIKISFKKNLEFKCEYCDMDFPQRNFYDEHVRKHTGEKPFLCSECGKALQSQHSLRVHLLRHKGNKSYHCTLCPKTFVCSSGLYGHMMSHKKPKAHVCDVCGKAFHFAVQLKTHMLYHNNVRNFKCEHCDLRFVLAQQLRRHQLTHTGEKPFRCKYCERAFSQNNDCLKHMKKHVGGNVYLCKLCPLRFPLARDLQVHFNSHKNDDEETRARNLEARAEAEKNLKIKLNV